MMRWGDVCLLFDHDSPGAPPRRGRTDAPWTLVHRGGAGTLWAQAPTADWIGYGVREVTASAVDAEERGDARAWLLGETWGPTPSDGPSDDSLLEIARGGGDPDAIVGSWLLVARADDAERGPRWSVVTDRLGTVHAYRVDAEPAAVATSFRALVERSRRRLDPAGVAGFFATGFYPGERTGLADVRILRPAKRYVFSGGGSPGARGERGRLVEIETTWRWPAAFSTTLSTSSYDDAIDAFDETLRRVMADLVAGSPGAPTRVAVPISGGLDSRSTVAALPPGAGEDLDRLWSFSYGWGRGSIETRIARRVAAARGLGFVALEIEPYLLDRWPSVHAAVEGFQDLAQTRQVSASALLAARADAVIAAHWGDVFLDSMGVSASSSGEEIVDHALRRVLKQGRGWLLDHLARPLLDPHDPAAADPEGVVREQVTAELARLARIESPDARTKAFKTEQWSFRWTLASLRAYRLGSVPRMPFYDSRLVDLCASLRPEWLEGRRLQRDHLLRHAPDLAKIPWQATGLSLDPSSAERATELASRAARKLGRLVAGRRVVERNWEAQFFATNRRGADRRDADRPERLRALLLRPGAPHLEGVERAEVENLLDRFAARPDAALGYTVSMLFTWAAWLADTLGEPFGEPREPR